MRKFLLYTAAILIATAGMAQPAKDMVVIKGTLHGDLKGYDSIYMFTRLRTDTAVIKDGMYTFSFPFTEAEMKTIYPQYVQAMKQMYRPFSVLISGPGTYYITSDISKGMAAAEVKGPSATVLYRQFEHDQDDAYKTINNATVQLYGDNWWQIDEKDQRYQRLQHSSDSLRERYLLPLIKNLVKSQPDSYASAYALLNSGRQIGSLETKAQLYAMLSERMQQSVPGKKFGDYIKGLESSRIGSQVADFSLPDPQGMPIDFKSLRGKYVLIDFWASWCAPCRKSFPHMREMYASYKNEKFEVYSISIDENKAAWLKAVVAENNPWLQSLDTGNISQKGFAVTGVPSTFLIDPQGKIIARELGFDPDGNSEIEKKIKELFADNHHGNSGAVKAIPMMKMN